MKGRPIEGIIRALCGTLFVSNPVKDLVDGGWIGRVKPEHLRRVQGIGLGLELHDGKLEGAQGIRVDVRVKAQSIVENGFEPNALASQLVSAVLEQIAQDGERLPGGGVATIETEVFAKIEGEAFTGPGVDPLNCAAEEIEDVLRFAIKVRTARVKP